MRGSYQLCIAGSSSIGKILQSMTIYIYINVTGPQRPPLPQWSWSPLPPVVWWGGMVVVNHQCSIKVAWTNIKLTWLSVCTSKKGSMKRLEAKRVQWRDEAYLIATVLQSISSPLWWWCAADIASKEGGKEERKKGREGERKERKEKGRRERRKEKGREGERKERKEKGRRERRKEEGKEEGRKERRRKDEGKSSSPRFGGWGGYHWGGPSVPGRGTHICIYIINYIDLNRISVLQEYSKSTWFLHFPLFYLFLKTPAFSSYISVRSLSWSVKYT